MNCLLQTNSRLAFSLVVLLIIFSGLQARIVRAQSAGFEAGLAGQTANMTSNVIGMNSIKINGETKIRSGRATTTFIHSPDIYRYMLDYITFDETEPKTETGRMQLTQKWVSDFEMRMIKAGYKPHDYADAASFATMLSYQAQFDRKQLTPAELQIFNRFRQGTRQMLLKWADYQGLSDQVREKLYIWDAMASIQAIEWREKARTAKSDAERQEADQNAKHYAEEKMKLYTDENLRELEQARKQVK